MKTASKGSTIDWASWMWSALTGMTWSPQLPLSRRPLAFIVSTCSGHWSMSVTSWPAFVRSPPTMDPMAPAPTIPILISAPAGR